jgi:Protein of unknown function (DUF1681)
MHTRNNVSFVHSAETWNLANPIQTCQLIVEEQDSESILRLKFLRQSAIFCEAVLHVPTIVSSLASSPKMTVSQYVLEYWLQPVVDSSRYFVVKIVAPPGHPNREATIGFGFRDRNDATDLVQTIQHFLRLQSYGSNAESLSNTTTSATTKEHQASSSLSRYTVPVLADGEKIHINTTRIRKQNPPSPTGPKAPTATGKLLLRKPPSPPPSPTSASTSCVVNLPATAPDGGDGPPSLASLSLHGGQSADDAKECSSQGDIGTNINTSNQDIPTEEDDIEWNDFQ